MRIVQRCLVYVIGLSPTLMTEEAVCSKQFFGQYGSIVKCVVKRSKPKSCPAGLSYGGYITFSSELEAALCIEAVDAFTFEDRELQANYGTTKYCLFFLKGQACSKPDCLYLHQYGRTEDVFTREDIMKTKKIPHSSTVRSLGMFMKELPDGEEVLLPKVYIDRSRRISIGEDNSSPSSPTRRPKRKNSRFESILVEGSDEEGMEVPTHIEEIFEINSPVRDTSNIPKKHISKFLDPSSPERWMSDVVDTDDSDLVNIGKVSEDDHSTVGLRAKVYSKA
eukprot:CAMPEP_0204903602 /NCGR_PEP_ID=MMETSP1397-20131031/4370_1 /ASSEMBLY_ACC=CAM_ASM_000891 /TAXON_ID=49980 /ORGANISM="Climacostomum Climacostomum virens, Strain Stock W-24" /LENGTH=278 /DNA_ID=CAMNT_0052072279 /DNA_START=279 /DNA_END=1118 /DNA_ORIENTATION=-